MACRLNIPSFTTAPWNPLFMTHYHRARNNTFINNDVRGESRVFARGVSFPFLSFSTYVSSSLSLSLPSNPSFLPFLPFLSFFFFLCFKAEQLDVLRVTRRSAPFVASKRARTQRQCKVRGNSCDLPGELDWKRERRLCPF